MTNVPYNTNIPFASNSPSQDQPKMQENTNSLKSLIEIDHVGFGNNQGGYHQDIHQPVLSVGGQTVWNPDLASGIPALIQAAKIPGIQQIFPLNYTPNTTGGTADTQLFTLTGDGGISQLTGNSLPDGDGGWCWLGGILIQYGRIYGTHGSAPKNFQGGDNGTVTFKDRFTGAIPFPNNCFGVLAFLEYNNVSPNPTSGVGNVTINSALTSKTSFRWGIVTNSNQYTSFFWIAIGN